MKRDVNTVHLRFLHLKPQSDGPRLKVEVSYNGPTKLHSLKWKDSESK